MFPGMPETPEQIYQRAIEAADGDRRLAMPPVTDWYTFPFDGEISVRPLDPPVDAEPDRSGEGGVDCWRCDHGLENAIWHDDAWLVAPLPRPSGLPVIVLLFPKAHHDIDDLPEDLAGQLGPMLVRLEEAVREVGHIGRVHIGRWGDGSAHLHWWFIARPERIPQLRGSFAAIWDDILPPLPGEIWRENLSIVAAALARHGGVNLFGDQ